MREIREKEWKLHIEESENSLKQNGIDLYIRSFKELQIPSRHFILSPWQDA
jgi:hypothetical protein